MNKIFCYDGYGRIVKNEKNKKHLYRAQLTLEDRIIKMQSVNWVYIGASLGDAKYMDEITALSHLTPAQKIMVMEIKSPL